MTDNNQNDQNQPDSSYPPEQSPFSSEQQWGTSSQDPDAYVSPFEVTNQPASVDDQSANVTPQQPTTLFTQEPQAVRVDPLPEQQLNPYAAHDQGASQFTQNAYPTPGLSNQQYHHNLQADSGQPAGSYQHTPQTAPTQTTPGYQHHSQVQAHYGQTTAEYLQNPQTSPGQPVSEYAQDPQAVSGYASYPHTQNQQVTPEHAVPGYQQHTAGAPAQGTPHQHHMPHIPSVQPTPQTAAASHIPDPQAQPEQAPYPVKQKSKSKGSKGVIFLVGLLGVLVGAAISVGALYVATSGFSFSGSVDTSGIVIEPVKEDTELAEAVAAKVTPSVVNIDVYATPDANSLEDFFGSGSEDSSTLEQTGLGSGVILTNDGYIITNFHVIDGAEHLMVSINDEQLEATVVGTDAQSDLAVIKVEATDLVPIELGDSDDVSVGEWVMAVGSPFGLEKSVSTGIVSALYRSTAMQSQSGTTIYANLIQTDAAINPGNSGGALVNSEGKLIGINTLINSTSGSSSGVGFAMPINYAFDIAEKIINGEAIEHPYLGVTLYSVDTAVADELGLAVDSGAYIDSVIQGSPAQEAGLLVGDVITMAGGKRINTSSELIIEIRQHEIGSTVTFRVNRGGEDIDLNVVLGSTVSG